jgi:putative salt-induced outer membrane protein
MLEAFMAPVAQSILPDAETTKIATLPPGATRMLSAAVHLQDETKLAAVVTAAKLAFPEQHGAIDAFVADLSQPVTPLRVEPLVITGTPPAPQPYRFLENLTGQVDLNAANTNGNTETSNLGARMKLSFKRQARIHRLEAYANTGEANKTQIQENWGASYQLDTLWTDDVFGYARASYDRDAFSGFDERAFVGAGAGYYFLNETPLSVRGEVGPGYQYSKQNNNGNSDLDWVLYGALKTNWVLNKDWTLGHDSKVTFSDPNTSIEARSVLSTTLTDAIRAGMTYEVQYEENPPENRESLDRILKFNLSYGF